MRSFYQRLSDIRPFEPRHLVAASFFLKFWPLLNETLLLHSFPVPTAIARSYTDGAGLDYELPQQSIHHEIEWILPTTFICTRTSPFRGIKRSFENGGKHRGRLESEL